MKPRFLLTYFTFAARLLRGLVVVALMTDTIVASGQEVINFNAAHAYWSGTNYYESDMGFAVFPAGSNSRMLISPAVTSPLGNPYNNTPYMIFVPQSADDYVAFSLTNGDTFGLDSVFLADPWSPSATLLPIKFKGLKADGSQVNITFTTPGNNANSFETYLFGQDFASGLTNVEIHAARWAMDNLVVITGAAASPPNTVAVTPAQFGPPANFPTGSSPNALVVADFNRRGKLDIAVASYYNGVSLLRGMGDGTFAAPTNYTANGTGALATGDFNGDGKLDIVTRGYYGGSVLLNDGMGSFVRTNYT